MHTQLVTGGKGVASFLRQSSDLRADVEDRGFDIVLC